MEGWLLARNVEGILLAIYTAISFYPLLGVSSLGKYIRVNICIYKYKVSGERAEEVI